MKAIILILKCSHVSKSAIKDSYWIIWQINVKIFANRKIISIIITKSKNVIGGIKIVQRFLRYSIYLPGNAKMLSVSLNKYLIQIHKNADSLEAIHLVFALQINHFGTIRIFNASNVLSKLQSSIINWINVSHVNKI